MASMPDTGRHDASFPPICPHIHKWINRCAVLRVCAFRWARDGLAVVRVRLGGGSCLERAHLIRDEARLLQEGTVWYGEFASTRRPGGLCSANVSWTSMT